MWERLYQLWIAYADQLRRELGEAPAENLLREAHQVLPTLRGRRAAREEAGPAGPKRCSARWRLSGVSEAESVLPAAQIVITLALVAWMITGFTRPRLRPRGQALRERSRHGSCGAD